MHLLSCNAASSATRRGAARKIKESVESNLGQQRSNKALDFPRHPSKLNVELLPHPVTVLAKLRTLEKANRVVATVMNGGHAELAGKKARIIEG